MHVVGPNELRNRSNYSKFNRIALLHYTMYTMMSIIGAHYYYYSKFFLLPIIPKITGIPA